MIAYENKLQFGYQEQEKRIDREKDLIVSNFASFEIKALHENGWFVAKINYCKSLKEYHDSYKKQNQRLHVT